MVLVSLTASCTSRIILIQTGTSKINTNATSRITAMYDVCLLYNKRSMNYNNIKGIFSNIYGLFKY